MRLQPSHHRISSRTGLSAAFGFCRRTSSMLGGEARHVCRACGRYWRYFGHQKAQQAAYARSYSTFTCPSSLPHYADLRLDRAADLRKDASKLQELTKSESARLVLLHAYDGLLVPTTADAGPKWRLHHLPAAALTDDSIDECLGRIFLGLDESKRPYFAVSVTDDAAAGIASESDKAEWVELRREGGPNLPADEAALIAYAAGMVYWARRNTHSATSGEEMQPLKGGHSRAAKGERAVFTRIDPAVIMAVTCGDWILLGRQSRWSKGRFSLLAGFCEIGETLEQAVVRETLEEAGIPVALSSVRYHSSQPWPFPQSLMIGFTAEAGSAVCPGGQLQGEGAQAAARQGLSSSEVEGTLGTTPAQPNPDDEELESAHWFHRSFVADSLQGLLPIGIDFAIPGPHALANRIIGGWAREACNEAQPSWCTRIPDVEVDLGRFKYVLLRLRSREDDSSKLCVRGSRSCAYHADIVEAAAAQLAPDGIEVDVLGGGRIENNIQSIHVFGYSSAFGAAPHEVTAALLRREYPTAAIEVSYSGY